MFINIIITFIFQIMLIIGVIYLFGFIIGLINKLKYKNYGRFGLTLCRITGIIGTPIHELSHALFCIIFGHKIVEMKLFQINSDDNTLGYVNHTYNPKNIYQKMGNFFIGIAPILVISIILYVLSIWLLPTLDIKSIANNLNDLSINNIFNVLWNFILEFFKNIFSLNGLIFLIISLFLTSHMTLSKADLKGSLIGLIILIVIILLLNIILGFISIDIYNNYCNFMNLISIWLFIILSFSVIISLVFLIISFIFKLIINHNK